MKIVNIIGGLGNQMFQYAFAEALKTRFPGEDVLLDTSHFKFLLLKKLGSANLHNGYEIKKVFPNADLPIATSDQLRRVTYYIPNYALSRIARRVLPVKKTELIQKAKEYFAYNPLVFEREGDCYYEGIWESIHYLIPIKETILKSFAHPIPNKINSDLIFKMENESSVGIHIRRGDYLNSDAFRGICDLDYYKRAIKIIIADGKSHSFYVFSNDLAWCEDNVIPLLDKNPIKMISHNTKNQSCWDMFLMSHCKDLIIANSSFSWWGAFLNKRCGRIIAPQKWTNRVAEYDIWLPEWYKI